MPLALALAQHHVAAVQQIVAAERPALGERDVVDVDAAAGDQAARLALAGREAGLDQQVDDVAADDLGVRRRDLAGQRRELLGRERVGRGS